jgi:DNA-binding SARP family transcriptional activator/pimeloyl-ACP methyl ester carboxylesterase
MMDIGVLGPLAVRSGDGLTRAIAARRQRLLLAVLAAHAPRAVSPERLADAQWPDDAPTDPSAALHTLLSRLRAALGAPVIERVPHGYRLALAAGTTDAARFESLLALAREAASPEHALALVEKALALWRGEPYEEFADVHALASEVARLRELRTAARERRVELLLALGGVAQARAHAELLVRDDPLRERPRALLMEAAYRTGRPADALATYQQFRRLLAEELGLEPSPALRELELQVIRHERSLAGTPPATAVVSDAPPREMAVPAAVLPLRIALVSRVARIALAQAGTGAPVLVLPAWVSSLAAIGAGLDPRAPLLASLACRCALTLYDRPGMGLSRAEHGGVAHALAGDARALDDDVADALAVLDATGVVRTTVLAMSQAGPVALALAARHPERVSRLVLLGTYASGAHAFPRADVRASIVALVRAHWGLGSRVLAEIILPGAGDQGAATYARLQREAATPEVAARALERLYEADVRDLLPRVRQPALVLHYTGDTAVPFRAGQQLAAELPDARLVPLAGRLHLPAGADVDRVAGLVAGLTG